MITRRSRGWAVGDQRVEIGERPEERIDVAVVRDVVAEVGHGRRIERRDPDGVDPKVPTR